MLKQLNNTNSSHVHTIGWGLSAYLPYYLYGSAKKISELIDSNPQHDSALYLNLPLSSPDRLTHLSVNNSEIILFADPCRFGAEIRSQIRKVGDFVVHDACVWAEQASNVQAIQAQGEFLMQHIASNTALAQPNHVMLFINQLDRGGAERQMVLLALGLRKLGWTVNLVTQMQDGTESECWSAELIAAGVGRIVLPGSRQLWQTEPPSNTELEWLRPLCQLLRPRGSHNVLSLSRLLKQYQPELLISYLDDCNIPAALAGLIAGTPNILIAGRNLEPYKPWVSTDPDYYVTPMRHLHGWYQHLLKFNHIRLYNNSIEGAISYDQWLSAERPTAVVPNAVEVLPGLSTDVRLKHGFQSDDLVILGIMRMSHEKNPSAFIRIVESLHRKNKKIKAILLGDGPLKQEMQQLVEVSGLSDILIFAGKHPYPGDYLRQADLLLATSNVEGMPNAILEAQVMACPLVATAAGGTQEALEPELHNRLAAPGDETTLENLALEALRNLSDYKQLMLLVQTRILSRRSVKNLAIQTINLREQNLWQPRT